MLHPVSRPSEIINIERRRQKKVRILVGHRTSVVWTPTERPTTLRIYPGEEYITYQEHSLFSGGLRGMLDERLDLDLTSVRLSTLVSKKCSFYF